MRKTYTAVQVASALMAAPDDRHWGRALSNATGAPTGSLVPVLKRMLDAGWLSDGWEIAAEAHAEGRPPRRYYEVTPEGRVALRAMLAEAGERFGVVIPADTLKPGDKVSLSASGSYPASPAVSLADALKASLTARRGPVAVTETTARERFDCCKHCKHSPSMRSHDRKCVQCP
jgi:PadR family transcriptional regulator, regulatory protein PadR